MSTVLCFVMFSNVSYMFLFFKCSYVRILFHVGFEKKLPGSYPDYSDAAITVPHSFFLVQCKHVWPKIRQTLLHECTWATSHPGWPKKGQ